MQRSRRSNSVDRRKVDAGMECPRRGCAREPRRGRCRFRQRQGPMAARREEFQQLHRSIHQAHLRQSAWSTRQYHLRPLAGGLVLVHLEWTINGELAADGGPKPPRNGIFTWLVAHRDGSWRIIAAHNTNLADGVVHRLGSDAPA
jgi:hypothetical protein